MSRTVSQMTLPPVKAIEHVEAAIAQLKQIPQETLYELFPWDESAEIRAALKILTGFAERYEKRDKVTVEVVRVAHGRVSDEIVRYAGKFYSPS